MREEIIGSARLILGDCREIEVKADLVCSDPPYGVGYDPRTVTKKRSVREYAGGAYGRDWTAVIGDDRPFDPTHLLAYSNAILWGANNYADKLPSSACWFSWDRKAGKAASSDITDCELAWVRGLPFKTVRQFTHMWAGFQRDSEVGERHLHPTQKPIALFAWCISFFPKTRTVFDPYMGSGSSGVAAIRGGREFIGIELDPDHFDTAVRRIEAAQRQSDMFISAPVAEDPADQRLADLFAEPTP